MLCGPAGGLSGVAGDSEGVTVGLSDDAGDGTGAILGDVRSSDCS